MSVYFSNNYNDPNYWNLNVQKNNIFDMDFFKDWMLYCYDGTTNRCCPKKEECKKKIDEFLSNIKQIDEYCDITEIITLYNNFIKQYEIDINYVIDKYNHIIEKMKTISVNKEIMNWIEFIQKKFKQIGKIEKIKFRQFVPYKTKLYICEDLHKILYMIKNDIMKKQKFLQKISQMNNKIISPYELYTNIKQNN